MPQTRMGNVAVMRATWIKAQAYKRKWDKYDKNGGDMPERDLAMDTLIGRARRPDPGPQPLLPRRRDGDHDRYGEGVRLQDRHASTTRSRPTRSPTCCAANGICAAMWADWWGFKMEAYDGINENIPLVDKAGACAIVHSDDANGIQRLNQEAAKALADGRRMGINISDEHRLDLAQLQSGEGARHRRQDRAACRPARWPTSCCGTAIRSASTRGPSRSGSTAR